jgi:hypothetical protein
MLTPGTQKPFPEDGQVLMPRVPPRTDFASDHAAYRPPKRRASLTQPGSRSPEPARNKCRRGVILVWIPGPFCMVATS